MRSPDLNTFQREHKQTPIAQTLGSLPQTFSNISTLRCFFSSLPQKIAPLNFKRILVGNPFTSKKGGEGFFGWDETDEQIVYNRQACRFVPECSETKPPQIAPYGFEQGLAATLPVYLAKDGPFLYGLLHCRMLAPKRTFESNSTTCALICLDPICAGAFCFFRKKIVGGFKYFLFTSSWGSCPIWLIFFKWVEPPPR